MSSSGPAGVDSGVKIYGRLQVFVAQQGEIFDGRASASVRQRRRFRLSSTGASAPADRMPALPGDLPGLALGGNSRRGHRRSWSVEPGLGFRVGAMSAAGES
jgi:hypothetical protein